MELGKVVNVVGGWVFHYLAQMVIHGTKTQLACILLL